MTKALGFFSTAVMISFRRERSAALKQPATRGPRPAPTTKRVLLKLEELHQREFIDDGDSVQHSTHIGTLSERSSNA